MKARDRDYSLLEGTEITFIDNGKAILCIVDGCDYDIGITLREKNKSKQYVLCLNGPSAIDYISDMQYPARFFNCVRQLKKGTYNPRILRIIEKVPSYGVYALMTECAFI